MEIFIQVGFYLILLLLLLVLVMYVHKRYPRTNLPFLTFLFFYRIPFIFIYLNFLPGDWKYYFQTAESGVSEVTNLEFGTDSLYYFTRPLVITGLSVTEVFFAFSFIGYLGIVLFYLMGHRLTNYSDQVKVWGINIFPWILLYPSLHMFTVMLGKDPLVLFGIGLIGYSLAFNSLRKIYLLMGLGFLLIIRPHIMFVALVSVVVTLLWSREWNGAKKFMLLTIAAIGGIFIFPFMVSFFRIADFSLEAIQLAIELNQGYSEDASTFVDMSSYPFPLKMFTYLFRPLFIDAPNVMLLVYSFENLLFLSLSFILIKITFIPWIKKQSRIIKFSLVFLTLGTMVLSNALSVFGLFMRQKTMVFLFLLLLIFAFIHHRNQTRTYLIKPVDSLTQPSSDA